jgi:dihydrofolate synthase/folylpolyglutamate synthase
VCADPQPPQSLLAHARQLGAPLCVLGRDFFLEAQADGWRWRGPNGSELSLPRPALPGAHQLRNAAGVVMVLQALARVLPVDPAALRQGLLNVRLAGRFQVLPGPPRQIFDVAHNPQGAQILAQALASEPCAGRTRLVLAMLADKDIAGVIAALRTVVHDWYLAPLDPPRGAALATLTAAMPALPYRGFDSVSDAFAAALHEAQPADRVVVTGSFHTVAAALVRAV